MSDLKTYLSLTRYRKTFERTLHQIDLALLVREMREDVGLTQAELAKKAGTIQSVIEINGVPRPRSQSTMGTCWSKSCSHPSANGQQMGHASAAMTALYTGEIPLEDIRTEFRLKFGPTICRFGNAGNETAA